MKTVVAAGLAGMLALAPALASAQAAGSPNRPGGLASAPLSTESGRLAVGAVVAVGIGAAIVCAVVCGGSGGSTATTTTTTTTAE